MTYCTWDNLLLYLCLNGCIFKLCNHPRMGGRAGFNVCVHLEVKVRGRKWGGGGGQKLIITTGLYQECLHQGSGQDRVCPLRNRNIFLHQSHHQSAASSSRYYGWMISELQRIFFFFFCLFFYFKRQSETVFFCMTKCRLFIGSCAR